MRSEAKQRFSFKEVYAENSIKYTIFKLSIPTTIRDFFAPIRRQLHRSAHSHAWLLKLSNTSPQGKLKLNRLDQFFMGLKQLNLCCLFKLLLDYECIFYCVYLNDLIHLVSFSQKSMKNLSENLGKYLSMLRQYLNG